MAEIAAVEQARQLAASAQGSDYYGDEELKVRVNILAQAIELLCDAINGLAP